MTQKNPNIVGFAGRKGAGKSLAASLLPNYEPRAFAGVLKDMARKAFPELTLEDVWGDSESRERPLLSRPIEVCPYCGSQALAWWFPKLKSNVEVGMCKGCPQEFPRFLTPRIILQTLGTEWGRRLDPDVWVRTTLNDVTPDQRLAFTDVRFPNEVAGLRDLGGKVFFLLRGYRGDRVGHAHPSEQLRPEDCDVVLDNRDMTPRQLGQLLLTYFDNVNVPLG